MTFGEFKRVHCEEEMVDVLDINTEQHFQGKIKDAPAAFNSIDVEYANYSTTSKMWFIN